MRRVVAVCPLTPGPSPPVGRGGKFVGGFCLLAVGVIMGHDLSRSGPLILAWESRPVGTSLVLVGRVTQGWAPWAFESRPLRGFLASLSCVYPDVLFCVAG